MQYQYQDQPTNCILASNSPYIGVLLKLHLEQSPGSKIRERKNIFASFCQNFSHRKASQITSNELRDWLVGLQHKNHYSERNLLAIKPLLNHFFKFLVSDGYLASNPLENLQLNSRTPPTRQRILLSEMEVIAALKDLKRESPWVVFPFIFCLAHTGARRDEIRKLRWSDVDLHNRLIHLKITKNGENRSLKMSDPLFELLHSSTRIKEWVFLNQFGRLISVTQIDDAIIRLQKNHPEMKRWRCHDLRHSYAYNFLKQGGQMYQLQAILGHKSIQMTIDLYGQLRAADIEKINLYPDSTSHALRRVDDV